VLETIKVLAISKRSILKRCTIADTDGSRHYFQNREGAVVLTAHFGNWEWAGLSIGLNTKNRPLQVIFLKLKNRITDKTIIDTGKILFIISIYFFDLIL